MKTAKLRKNNKKQEKEIIKEEYSAKTMITIVVIILAIFLMFYLITTLVVKPVKQSNTDNPITEIDSTKITLSHLLDRSEEEYYVLATKKSLYSESVSSKINYTEIYNKYIKDYKSKENSKPFYYVDLDDALNSNFVSEELNITDDIKNIKLNNEVLFKINNGKIEKYYVGNSEIAKALSNLKKSA